MRSQMAIGLMSGTSLDGVDAALIETDGIDLFRTGPMSYRPYSRPEREVLRCALSEAVALTDRAARPGAVADAEAVVTAAHVEAVDLLLRDHVLTARDIGIVGFHGQTVLHRPQSRLTVQIGDGEALAREIGIPVAYDFRAADVAAGGQGAPLVPIYHRALSAALECERPIAVINVGGVANLTYIDGDRELIAFDTGPGNALLDDFMHSRTGQPCDWDGVAAASGTVDHGFLAELRRHPYFQRQPPKSLDRNDFAGVALARASIPDGAATLTAVTVEAIALALDHLPQPPATFIISGGGARNRTLMRMLSARLHPASVLAADAVGWAGDAVEAQAFAFLAARTSRGLPITFPGTTGAPRPMPGGIVVRP
jgi:anhydro-N-acetylmuramic acid kinase